MHEILKGLNELEGVHGTLVADGSGQILAYQADAIYDAELLGQVSRAIVTALDSVRLLHDDWDSVTAQFAEGRLLIRSIPGGSRGKGSGYTLSVIADSRLNPAFAVVAIRVAVSKLKGFFDNNVGVVAVPPAPAPAIGRAPGYNSSMGGSLPLATSMGSSGGAIPMTAMAPAVSTGPKPSAPEVANSGLSWSGLGTSSTISGSGVSVADPASSAALTALTKALARTVGPMAKLFVKEGVRKVCPDRPFSKEAIPALLVELEKHIEDPGEVVQFRKLVAKPI